MASQLTQKVLYFLLVNFCFVSFSSQKLAIIPQPEKVVVFKDSLQIKSDINIDVQYLDVQSIQYLNQFLFENFKITTSHNKERQFDIKFVLLKNEGKKAKESYYKIESKKVGVSIEAYSQKGFFYGINSMMQLFLSGQRKGVISIPTFVLEDQPAYEWRGFMLDEARHFFGKAKVKQIIDWLAFYKLNKFHWHLTDEQGWRIEIKKYPYLTQIGGIGNFSDPYATAQFYTQEDIREIVAYASSRFIDIIPEIDMPGHATAANKAYSFLSGGGTKEHPDFTFHPAKESTYSFLKNVLDEINVLFPNNIIHLGGDEVAYGSDAWNNDELISELKSKNNLKSNKEVEVYFMKKMAQHVFDKGSKVAVWDEMVEGKLPSDKTIIYWWRHDKPEQLELSLEKGYQTIISPRLPFYLDFVQDEKHTNGRKWGKEFNPLERLYNYDITFGIQSEKYKGQILGFQGNLWTERVPNNAKLDFMIFPRLAALSEVCWINNSRKDYNGFLSVLKLYNSLYQAKDVYYYDVFDDKNPEPKSQKIIKRYIDNP